MFSMETSILRNSTEESMELADQNSKPVAEPDNDYLMKALMKIPYSQLTLDLDGVGAAESTKPCEQLLTDPQREFSLESVSYRPSSNENISSTKTSESGRNDAPAIRSFTLLNKCREKKKDEIQRLRDRMLHLQRELDNLRILYGIHDESDLLQVGARRWISAARTEKYKAEISFRENAHLRKSVMEMIKLNRSLRRTLQRQTLYTDLARDCTADWKLGHLVGERSARVQGIQAIAKRQLDMLSTILIETDLLFSDGNLQRDSLLWKRGAAKVAQVARSRVFEGINPKSLADASWILMLQQFLPVGSDCCEKVIDKIDRDTYYTRVKCTISGSLMDCRYIWKRYYMDRQIVILWTSVEEDAVYPREEGYMSCKDSGWIVIEDPVSVSSKTATTRSLKKFIMRYTFSDDLADRVETVRKWLNVISQYTDGCETMVSSLSHALCDKQLRNAALQFQQKSLLDSTAALAELMI